MDRRQAEKLSSCLSSLSHLGFGALYGASDLLSLTGLKMTSLEPSLLCPVSLQLINAAGDGGHLTHIPRPGGVLCMAQHHKDNFFTVLCFSPYFYYHYF